MNVEIARSREEFGEGETMSRQTVCKENLRSELRLEKENGKRRRPSIDSRKRRMQLRKTSEDKMLVSSLRESIIR